MPKNIPPTVPNHKLQVSEPTTVNDQDQMKRRSGIRRMAFNTAICRFLGRLLMRAIGTLHIGFGGIVLAGNIGGQLAHSGEIVSAGPLVFPGLMLMSGVGLLVQPGFVSIVFAFGLYGLVCFVVAPAEPRVGYVFALLTFLLTSGAILGLPDSKADDQYDTPSSC